MGRVTTSLSLEGYAPLVEFWAALRLRRDTTDTPQLSFPRGYRPRQGSIYMFKGRATDIIRILDNLAGVSAGVPTRSKGGSTPVGWR